MTVRDFSCHHESNIWYVQFPFGIFIQMGTATQFESNMSLCPGPREHARSY